MMILDSYRPSPGWFTHNPIGIHGIGHVSRVLVWADWLAEWMKGQRRHVDIEVVRWAAILHDVSRLDDGQDPDHGNRAARWLEVNCYRYFPTLSEDQLQAIRYCCIWHVTADRYIPRMTSELVCLKDADGLDRVRLGDLDPAYLRTPYSRSFMKDAQTLFEASQSPLESDPWATVREAALERGWWR